MQTTIQTIMASQSASEIQMGEITHIHGQSITLHNFNMLNTTVRSVANPIFNCISFPSFPRSPADDRRYVLYAKSLSSQRHRHLICQGGVVAVHSDYIPSIHFARNTSPVMHQPMTTRQNSAHRQPVAADSFAYSCL